jgi:hypothetical protein
VSTEPRTDPMVRADFDKLICQEPGCTTAHPHGKLKLSSLCHRRGVLRTRYWADGVVEVLCKTCNLFVVSFSVVGPEADRLRDQALACGEPDCKEPPQGHRLVLTPTCHKQAPLEGFYAAGTMSFACARCHAPLASLLVKGDTQ